MAVDREAANAGWPAPLTPVLQGELARLEPLGPEHAEALFAAGADPEVWRWLGAHHARDRATFDRWIGQAYAEPAFATIDRASGRVAGSTRFLELRPEHRGLEIGWTWLAPWAWRTGLNVEVKLLQLTHAFEALGCVRVEFKTDARNERSRRALSALPAHFEGIRRAHMVLPDGSLRDSAYYAVTATDWPAVRAALLTRAAARSGRRPAPRSPAPPAVPPA